MARCLVTGGTGFIGSHLSFALEAEGHEVTIVDERPFSEELGTGGFRGRVIHADVSHEIPAAGIFDFIFHEAAITDPRYPNDQEVLEKNIIGFENVLHLAKEQKAKLIYASTAGLYGNGPVPMQEDQPKEVLTAYGRSKLLIDERTFPLIGECAIVGLRYFNVFGPGENHKGRPASMILHLLRQMKQGHRPRIFEFGEHLRDFVYVKDAVRATLLARQAPSGIYNVGTGIGTSFNELIKVLNTVLRTDLAPEYFPMPYDFSTYQHHTVADTRLSKEKLKFQSEWPLESAVNDYLKWLVEKELL